MGSLTDESHAFIGQKPLLNQIPGPIKTLNLVDDQSVVGLGRLELPTSRLSGVRSNHLSYRPLDRGMIHATAYRLRDTAHQRVKGGGARRIRTDDPLRAKQVLSHLSYSPLSVLPSRNINHDRTNKTDGPSTKCVESR